MDPSCSLLSVLVLTKASVPRFLYVTNGSGGISQFRFNKDSGALTSLGSVPAAGNAFKLVVDVYGTFGVLTCDLSNTLQVFQIDANSGQLTLTDTQSNGIIATPFPPVLDSAHNVVHVPMNGGSQIVSYAVSASGKLSNIGTVPTGGQLQGLTLHPGGAYVIAAATSNAYAFKINSNGSLTQSGNAAAGLGPNRPVITPNGKFVYVSNTTSGTISAFSFDESLGALTLIEHEPAASAVQGAVNSVGTLFANTDNAGSTTGFSFAIQSNGSLQSSGTFAYGTGGSNQAPMFSPTADILYVPLPSLGVVSMTSISAASAPVQNAQVSAITGLANPVLDPSGKFVFMPSNGTSQVTGFRVLPNGQLGLLATYPATSATQVTIASFFEF